MTRRKAILASLLSAIGAGGLYWHLTRAPSAASVRTRLTRSSVPKPAAPLAVFHLGHSLVNRDMPAMLAQMAPGGHRYDSQLGWGTTLQAHWGHAPINGFEAENAHPRFRPALEAVRSGDYDAIVLTEMVEIRASIRYYDSPVYLARWAGEALKARPDVRLYLYETWHQLDDPEGWLERLDRDHDRYWLSRVLGPALERLPAGSRIHLIPAGQVLAAFVRAVEARGGLGNVRDRTDLFSRAEDGTLDVIHLNDLGNYLVALVHYTALYQQSPLGLPHALLRADGSVAVAPDSDVARLMQETTDSVVRNLGLSGLSA
ncbi:hypothetical protein [Rhodobacter calidifons]|uniref:SGNH/GDSL hydrolase family protein n=1 Tax=Rhodobacter calidifons TaxID=2715277 RepID=A0ABX0G801_9RHOB|nr:hypothetical protein [Rhodobacter calidifons]NHB77062.1 hypothetical protein [Rhodobacter calidifons]